MHSTAPFKAYSIADPALDLVAMSRDAQRYLYEHDPALIKVREGMVATVFTVRRIDTDVFAHFVESEPEASRNRAAFRFGVTAIEHIESHQNGTIFKRLEPGETQQAFGRAIGFWGDEHLEHVPPAYIGEIGWLAYMRSFLPRASAACLQPPRSLLAVLAGRVSSLVAEQTAELHRLRTSAALLGPTPARDGATATAATADPKPSKRRRVKKAPFKRPAKRKKPSHA